MDRVKELKKIERFFNYTVGEAFKRDFKNAAMEVGRRLVDNTPRFFEEHEESGNTVANWRVTTDNSVDSTYQEGIADFSGNDTKSALATEIWSSKLPDIDAVITFSNSTPWIEKLEFGLYPTNPKYGSRNKATGQYEIRSSGGFSKQAPAGIAGPVAMQWDEIVQDAVGKRFS